MATFDHGGGCACGLYKVCVCEPKIASLENNKSGRKLERKVEYVQGYLHERVLKEMANKDFDFGFSTHSEQELTVEDKTKLIGLKNMIMPLLVNLMKDPDKDVIRWPNRKQKIEEFIKQIDEYIAK